MKKVSSCTFIALAMTLTTKLLIYTLPMVDGVKEIYMQLKPDSGNSEVRLDI